jgi:hypothetical protein
MDTDYYEALANQRLDRSVHDDDRTSRAEDVARGQVYALLALASAVDRLARATETQG